jgi:hypothetical protein
VTRRTAPTPGWWEPPCSHPELQRRYYRHGATRREALAARTWQIHEQNPTWPDTECWKAALGEAAISTRRPEAWQ